MPKRFTYTLIEALKTGKRIRIAGETGELSWIDPKQKKSFSPYELECDYEVEEEEICLTKTQIITAISACAKERAARANYTLQIFTPTGIEGLDSKYGLKFIQENMNDFLAKLGFK